MTADIKIAVVLVASLLLTSPAFFLCIPQPEALTATPSIHPQIFLVSFFISPPPNEI